MSITYLFVGRVAAVPSTASKTTGRKKVTSFSRPPNSNLNRWSLNIVLSSYLAQNLNDGPDRSSRHHLGLLILSKLAETFLATRLLSRKTKTFSAVSAFFAAIKLPRQQEASQSPHTSGLFQVTMFARSATLLLALLAANVGAKTIVPDFEVKADSKLGKRLLSKARALDGERDWTWVANYSIKYRGCSSLVQLANEMNGGDEGEGLLYTQNLVKFSLCPSDSSCDSCKGGADYVVNMMEFVDAWTENKMNSLERTCENIRENCYCNNNYNDDEACENQCFTDAEMTECIQIEGEEEFEIQRYLECAGRSMNVLSTFVCRY